MNGAESLIRTLMASGVEVCFANPGTTELYFVMALDKIGGVHSVLGLAETVVTGCADGYARMAEKPAITLLHCGPGFANGIANLHNARRANTPIVNIVGDQATYHRPFDPPLTADTEGLARAVSHWVKRSSSAQQLALDAAEAVQSARTAPGQIATLIVPADVSWNEGGEVTSPLRVPARQPVAPEVIESAVQILRSGQPTMLLLSGKVIGQVGLLSAQRIAHATGAILRTPTQVHRMARGRGRPPVDRIPYSVDRALQELSAFKHMILVGSRPPAGFFAYPGKPSLLSPPDCEIHILATPKQDSVAALEHLADALSAPKVVPIPEAGPKPSIGKGRFEAEAFAMTFAALLPEDAIVVEDAVTSGRAIFPPTFNAAPHDWLQITGGSIGHGFPCATGAAVACRDRKIICLQSDGGGMYSAQALWTQARENLDVVNVVFSNRAYLILYAELHGAGQSPGPASNNLFRLDRPGLDWVALANAMGVEAGSVETLEGFAELFRAACGRRGPFLIEFRIS